MLRITAYCERLIQDLEPLNWPEPIKLIAAQLDRADVREPKRTSRRPKRLVRSPQAARLAPLRTPPAT
jgi:hypothetical protein